MASSGGMSVTGGMLGPNSMGDLVNAGALNPTDMEIDVEDSFGADYEASGEKMDADFFNDFEDDFDDEDLE